MSTHKQTCKTGCAGTWTRKAEAKRLPRNLRQFGLKSEKSSLKTKQKTQKYCNCSQNLKFEESTITQPLHKRNQICDENNFMSHVYSRQKYLRQNFQVFLVCFILQSYGLILQPRKASNTWAILLPQPSKCWDYDRSEVSHKAWFSRLLHTLTLHKQNNIHYK